VNTTDASYFDQKYEALDDPWSFASDPYEQARYRAVLSHVTPGRYARAFEPGCSIGVLTAELAKRCGHVYATDISSQAVALAKLRCSTVTNVDFNAERLTDSNESERYDLIVFSEIGYYYTAQELDEVVVSLARALATGGRLIAAHWLGFSPDHILQGAYVHHRLIRALPFHRHEQLIVDDPHRVGFVLDVWDREVEAT
jgi:SAM-dependent methyltransferase